MNQRLTELQPMWVGKYDAAADTWEDDVSLSEAQGIMFDHPLYGYKILLWFRGKGIPNDAQPGPGRWEMAGVDFGNLTLSPSIDCTCNGKFPHEWHGWIRNGEVT